MIWKRYTAHHGRDLMYSNTVIQLMIGPIDKFEMEFLAIHKNNHNYIF